MNSLNITANGIALHEILPMRVSGAIGYSLMRDFFMDEWKPVVGWEDRYEISNTGRLRSIAYSRVERKSHICNKGYVRYNLYKDNKNNGRGAHRLVSEAFLGSSFLDVNHKDGNKSNNHVSNLEYISHRENINHSKKSKNLTGTRYDKSSGKWRSSLKLDGKEVSLGSFTTEKEAHEVYLNKIT